MKYRPVAADMRNEPKMSEANRREDSAKPNRRRASVRAGGLRKGINHETYEFTWVIIMLFSFGKCYNMIMILF